MRKSVVAALLIVLVLTLIVVSLHYFVQSFLPSGMINFIYVFLLALVAIIGVLAGLPDLADRLSDSKKAKPTTQKPNIVVDGFKLERPFHLIRNGLPAEIVERYYVMFRNTKLPGKTITDTKPIHAIVSFYNTDCEILDDLSHEEPFWLDLSGRPWERPDNFKVIISASSKPEGLCLIVKQRGRSDLFVFCDKSYISNFRTLEPFQDSLRIPFHMVYVQVQLISENLEMEPIWISITNQGERQPSFEIIEAPCEID